MAYDPNAPWGTEGLQGAVAQSLDPYMSGPFGYSPATQAATSAWLQNTAPVIQNQLQLQGLGNGPIVADVMGRSMATALPQFVQNDLTNRLAATNAASNFGATNLIPAWGQQTGQQAQTLQGLSSAGEVQRGMEQDLNDAAREEQLRQQGLSEATTSGLFGSTSPPTISTTTGAGK